MASLDEVFGADREAQENGRWVDYGPCKIKIAFAGDENPSYMKTLERCTRGIRDLLGGNNTVANTDSMPEVKAALMRVYSKAVIKDWAGVSDADGNPIPFSEKACFEAFQRLPAFFRWARAFSDDLNNFQPDEAEGDGPNS